MRVRYNLLDDAFGALHFAITDKGPISVIKRGLLRWQMYCRYIPSTKSLVRKKVVLDRLLQVTAGAESHCSDHGWATFDAFNMNVPISVNPIPNTL